MKASKILQDWYGKYKSDDGLKKYTQHRAWMELRKVLQDKVKPVTEKTENIETLGSLWDITKLWNKSYAKEEWEADTTQTWAHLVKVWNRFLNPNILARARREEACPKEVEFGECSSSIMRQIRSFTKTQYNLDLAPFDGSLVSQEIKLEQKKETKVITNNNQQSHSSNNLPSNQLHETTTQKQYGINLTITPIDSNPISPKIELGEIEKKEKKVNETTNVETNNDLKRSLSSVPSIETTSLARFSMTTTRSTNGPSTILQNWYEKYNSDSELKKHTHRAWTELRTQLKDKVKPVTERQKI